MCANDPLLGRLIDGRFRIEERLGAGGMGVVYKARQIHVDRVVALKVVRPDRAGDDAAKALLAEARAVSQLTSPHTVRLIDVGPIDGGVFLAMELLEGCPLAARLGAPMPWEKAVGIADQIALSLAEAHARGMVHRDLKPLNVFVARTPGHAEVVKVLDFGLAALVHGDHDHASGGTPRYMAPERLAGAAPDPRADVYALGLILHEMLCGKHPFEGLAGEALIEAQLGTASPPLPDEVPEPLQRLVHRCLAKHPRLRPRDGSTLRRELRSAAGLREDDAFEGEGVARPSAPEQDTLATLPATLSLPGPPARSSASEAQEPRPIDPPRRGSRLAKMAAVAASGALAVLGWWGPSAEVARPGLAVSPLVVPVSTTVAPTPPAEVAILVHSVPDGAAVVVDGQSAGETPVPIRMTKGTRAVIELSLPGYVPAEIVVEARDDERIRHVFEPVAPRPVDPVRRKVERYLD